MDDGIGWRGGTPLAEAGRPQAIERATCDSISVPPRTKSPTAKPPTPKPPPPAQGVQVVDIDEDPPTPPGRLTTNVTIFNVDMDRRVRHATDDTERAQASHAASIGEESTTTARQGSLKG